MVKKNEKSEKNIKIKIKEDEVKIINGRLEYSVEEKDNF